LFQATIRKPHAPKQVGTIQLTPIKTLQQAVKIRIEENPNDALRTTAG